MTGRLERLTDEQRRQLHRWSLVWNRHGLSTRPADRPAAEDTIRLAYACAGLPPPEHVVWCESPMSQALTHAIVLSKEAGLYGSVGRSVWSIVRESVRQS